jgi:hypothetical protein
MSSKARKKNRQSKKLAIPATGGTSNKSQINSPCHEHAHLFFAASNHCFCLKKCAVPFVEGRNSSTRIMGHLGKYLPTTRCRKLSNKCPRNYFFCVQWSRTFSTSTWKIKNQIFWREKIESYNWTRQCGSNLITGIWLVLERFLSYFFLISVFKLYPLYEFKGHKRTVRMGF